MNFTPKNAIKYFCENCDFKCFKQSDWDRHLITRKHIKVTIGDQILHPIQEFICNNCNKQYKSKNGLWKHKKICNIKNLKNENQENEDKLTKITTDISLVIDFVKEQLSEHSKTNKNNQELQKLSLENQQQMFNQMMEFMKQQSSTTNNIINGNVNNNYTQFNLQVYLNETCKNAMNIDQFIEYLQPTLQELEDTARLGYVEGITRIILRGLKDLEESERPFHCSDLKRETMFVKNNNDIWEKEPDEKPQLMKVVKAISRKNFCNVSAWQKEHPTWKSYDSKYNDQYNQILIHSTSGATEEEQRSSYEKIIKNIAKEIVINKSKKNSK